MKENRDMGYVLQGCESLRVCVDSVCATSMIVTGICVVSIG